MKKFDSLVLLLALILVGVGTGIFDISINFNNFGNYFIAISGILVSYYLNFSREVDKP